MANWGIFGPSNYAGVDQGVDFRGAGQIPALGPATVTDVGRAHIIEGGTYPYVVYRLDSGPYRGRYVYVAENFVPAVHVGQHLKEGQSMGAALGSYPFIEIGFNKTPQGWNAVAPLGGATATGQAMKRYIYGLIGTAPPVTVPFNPAQAVLNQVNVAGSDPIQGAINTGRSVADLIGRLLDPAFWLRALELVGGFLIAMLGLYLLARQAGVAGVPQPPTPGLSEGTIRDLQEPPGIEGHKPAYRRSTEGVKRDKVVHDVSEQGARRKAIRERSERARPDFGDVPF